MVIVFWLSVFAVAYVYAGYPLLLRLWARLRPADSKLEHVPVSWFRGFVVSRSTTDDTAIDNQQPAANDRRQTTGIPTVSIVIAARNEAHRLAARIQNLLALDYPADRRQIIVVSDGSTDDTLAVLERFRGTVDVVALPPGGKATALNAGVALARHDVLVFADARQMYAPDALRELAAPLHDPRIGGVTGELVLDAESALFANRRTASDRRRSPAVPRDITRERRLTPDRRRTLASTIADGVGMYWRYEKTMRRLESAIGSTLGATGAIYAIRRSLWRPLPPDTILDDVLTPMRVVLAGYRVVFNERAQAFDRAATDADAEARRKVRTLAGNYQLLTLEPRLLLPWRNPVWLQFVSHKLGRLAVPYLMLVIFAASIALSGTRVYLAALTAQVGFYLLAGYGAMLEAAARRRAAAEDAVKSAAAVNIAPQTTLENPPPFAYPAHLVSRANLVNIAGRDPREVA